MWIFLLILVWVFAYQINKYFPAKKRSVKVEYAEQTDFENENFIPAYYRKTDKNIAKVYLFLAGWLMRKNRMESKTKLNFTRSFLFNNLDIDNHDVSDLIYESLRYSINIRSIAEWVNKHFKTSEEKIKMTNFLIDLAFEDGDLIDREYIAIQRFAGLIGVGEEYIDKKIVTHRKRIYQDSEEFKKNFRTYNRLNRKKRALTILGLTEKATSSEIKTAYRSLVKELHPDAYGEIGKEEKEKRAQLFLDVQEAYEELND